MCAVARSLICCLFVLPLNCTASELLPPDLAGDPVPQVLTPARLKQAQVDAGASVTVIDREMIAALGARDVPEILRLVPGMMVTQESESGHAFAVNYHGTNLTDIRRLQVLVDGMSVYQSGLARILWSDLALAIDDIERIEVTRGPDAAAYGANSFSGVVNIITRHPQDSTDNMLRVTAGDRDVLDGAARLVAHSENSDGRLTIAARGDGGFDHVRSGTDARDDRRGGTMNWRSEYRPSDEDRLEVQFGLADTLREAEADLHRGLLTRYEAEPVTKTRNMNMLGRWSRELSPDHEFQVQFYTQRTETRNPFRACLDPLYLSSEVAALSARNLAYPEELAVAIGDWLATGPAMPPDDASSPITVYINTLPAADQPVAWDVVTLALTFGGAGFSEICGSVDLDIRESRADLEVQDTLRISERLRLVSGASFRRDSGASASYTGGQVDNDVWRLFGHGEFRVLDPLLLNVGAMLEDDGISGTGLSPRAALNWRVRDQQALRLVSSRATRTQDIYEEYAETRVNFHHLSPVYSADGGATTFTSRDLFLMQTAPGNLVPEEINSLEVGYFGYFPSARVEVDVRVFREHLNKLISTAMNPFDFSANNNSFTTLEGIEWQARRTLAPGSWLWASYAYIDNDSTHRTERRFTALHSGSLAVAHRFASRWSGSAAWYFSRGQNPTPINDDNFDRLDLRLARDVALGGSTSLQLSANLQGRFSARPHIHGDNFYDERINGYVGMQLNF